MAVVAVAYAIMVNVLAFALFGIDKRRAVAGRWRIREATLIGVALAGGWLGAKAGQRRFRHKTRKQPFARRLNAVGLMSLGLLTVFAAAIPLALAGVDVGTPQVPEWIVHLGSILEGSSLQGGDDPPERIMPTRFGPGSGDGM